MNILENLWIHLQETETCRKKDEKEPNVEKQIFTQLLKELQRKKVEISGRKGYKDLEKSKRGLSNACFYFVVLYISLIIVIFFQDPSNLDHAKILLGQPRPLPEAPQAPATDQHFSIYQKLRDYPSS